MNASVNRDPRHYNAFAVRRAAQVLIAEGKVDKAEHSLREALHKVWHVSDIGDHRPPPSMVSRQALSPPDCH